MTEVLRGPSRRHLLLAGLVLTGSVALPATGAASAATRSPVLWRAAVSANRWPIPFDATVQRIEGSGIDVRLLPGDVSVVLLHVARRYHYEVDALRSGEVVGQLTDRAIAEPYESNHLSGTAIALRPQSYPVGAAGGLFPQQLGAVRHILAECRGVVRWGGDEATPKESHFEIAVPPGDTALTQLAEDVRRWNSQPGQGAGAVNQSK